MFQGRFRSILVQNGAYIRRLARYIHLNPVEAKLVTQPEHYQWSSYNGYLERSEYTWLHTDRVLSHFGATRAEAIAEMNVHAKSAIDASIDAEEIHKSFRKGVFESPEFTEIYAPTKDFGPVELRKEETSCTIDSLVGVVCKEFGVSLDELCSNDKRRELVRARAVLARAAQLIRGLDLRRVCEVLDKHHGTISRLAVAARKDLKLESLANRLSECLA